MIRLWVFLSVFSSSSVTASSWSTAPDMPTARSEMHVGVMGHKIIVAGGIARFRTTDRCELFDTLSLNWTSCPNLPMALHHVAITGIGESIYAGGGYTNLRFSLLKNPPLWVLRPGAAKWQIEGHLPFEVGEHSFANLNDKLYLVGGRQRTRSTSELWRYDRGEWQQRANMNSSRDSFASVVHRGQLWVFGGRNQAQGALNQVERYDPVEDVWEVMASLPYRSGGLSAMVVDGEIYVMGGEDLVEGMVFDRQFRYDNISNVWVRAAPPPEPRHGAGSATVNGVGYLLGGGSQAGWRTIYSVSKTVQVLAP